MVLCVVACSSHMITYWFSEGQRDLSAQRVEEVGGCGQVHHEPVDLMQLLYLKARIHRLQHHTKQCTRLLHA